jgi:hypothetical protein
VPEIAHFGGRGVEKTVPEVDQNAANHYLTRFFFGLN